MSGVTYTTDNNGNLTNRGGDTFGYDRANRLTSATVSGVGTTYSYDGDGKRATTKIGSGATTTTIYDVAGGLPVVLDDGSSRYVWGAGGLAYVVSGISGNGVPVVYHTDGLGSVRALSDAKTGIIQTYVNDEFGVPVPAQPPSGQPFRFAGEQRANETGLTYLRAHA